MYLTEKEWTATFRQDAGKVFVIKKMSAYQTEMFAMKVLSAMGQSGVQLPDDTDYSTAGLLGFGINGLMKIHFDLMKPLLDEMFKQIHIKMDLATRPLVDSDILEVNTRFQLRMEFIKFHTDFFTEDGQQASPEVQAAAPVVSGSSHIRMPRKR